MSESNDAPEEPRWLSDEERQDWVAYLLATRLLWGQLERDMQRGAGMPLTYYEMLSVLSEEPGRSLRMAELSSRLRVSASRLSHAVSRLEEFRWLRRELSAGDRRSWVANLTDEGMEVVRAAAPIHVESVRNCLFDRLSPMQLHELGEISRALLRHPSPHERRSRVIDERQSHPDQKDPHQA
jgi:DNA-binding MarR family transcriptional regulator